MRTLILTLGIAVLCLSDVCAQNNPITEIQDRRTYKIDSCLYFQLPAGFRVRNVFDVSNGNTGVSTTFQSSAALNGFQYRGRGRMLVDNLDFIIWQQWAQGQTGEMILMVPDNALDLAQGDPDVILTFPIFINAFLTKIEDVVVEPPYPIAFQLQDLMATD